LTVDDFRLLNKIGVFNASQMDAAIWQFRAFETASLHYADEMIPEPSGMIGLWDTTIDAGELIASQEGTD